VVGKTDLIKGFEDEATIPKKERGRGSPGDFPCQTLTKKGIPEGNLRKTDKKKKKNEIQKKKQTNQKQVKKNKKKKKKKKKGSTRGGKF